MEVIQVKIIKIDFLLNAFKKTKQFVENLKMHFSNKWKAKMIAECFVEGEDNWNFCFIDTTK